MTKIDIFSGFLGAGKTTLIRKLIKEAYQNEKIVLVENEFGEVGVDGAFLEDAGIEVTEMNSGCICCSLSGDFTAALKEVAERFSPDRILIEPSGVGKLSDVVRAVEQAAEAGGNMQVNAMTVVADAKKCKMYLKNFGEFYKDQLEHAGCIVLSRTGGISEEKLAQALTLIRECNQEAVVVTTPWDAVSGEEILAAMERRDTLAAAVERLAAQAAEEEECDDPECECHHHHHHDHDDHEEEEHHHHHHDHEDEDEEEEHHHHHDHEDEDHEEKEHHHHHDHEGEDHEEEEHHHHHHHHHHHGHDADEIFSSIGAETARAYTKEELETMLQALDSGEFGKILRCKGVVAGEGSWYHFDYVPEEWEIREGTPAVTGRICVIGSELAEKKLHTLFGI